MGQAHSRGGPNRVFFSECTSRFAAAGVSDIGKGQGRGASTNRLPADPRNRLSLQMDRCQEGNAKRMVRGGGREAAERLQKCAINIGA
mmetsp:Transcript_43560/g.123428  ORF Transcript_43560/g.123428 Transcript_43560/m.123428 type:complete len:88 (+) Transcript_43560:3982-4245(+)